MRNTVASPMTVRSVGGAAQVCWGCLLRHDAADARSNDRAATALVVWVWTSSRIDRPRPLRSPARRRPRSSSRPTKYGWRRTSYDGAVEAEKVGEPLAVWKPRGAECRRAERTEIHPRIRLLEASGVTLEPRRRPGSARATSAAPARRAYAGMIVPVCCSANVSNASRGRSKSDDS